MIVNSVGGNSELVVLKALAASADTSKQAGILSQDQLENGNLLQAIEQQLAQFGSNMSEIEDFIAAYIASKKGTDINVGEGQALNQLQNLVTKLKADDAEGSKYGDQINKDQDELKSDTDQINDLSGKLSYGYWYKYYAEEFR